MKGGSRVGSGEKTSFIEVSRRAKVARRVPCLINLTSGSRREQAKHWIIAQRHADVGK